MQTLAASSERLVVKPILESFIPFTDPPKSSKVAVSDGGP